MSVMHKTTATHDITIEYNDECAMNQSALARQITAIGLLLRPNENRTIQNDRFMISIRTGSEYTPDDFFKEHQTFVDGLTKDRKEN